MLFSSAPDTQLHTLFGLARLPFISNSRTTTPDRSPVLAAHFNAMSAQSGQPIPPTQNHLDPQKKAMLLKKNRKLSRVFGETPDFADIQSAQPEVAYLQHHRRSTSAALIHPLPAPVNHKSKSCSNLRRAASARLTRIEEVKPPALPSNSTANSVTLTSRRAQTKLSPIYEPSKWRRKNACKSVDLAAASPSIRISVQRRHSLPSKLAGTTTNHDSGREPRIPLETLPDVILNPSQTRCSGDMQTGVCRCIIMQALLY